MTTIPSSTKSKKKLQLDDVLVKIDEQISNLEQDKNRIKEYIKSFKDIRREIKKYQPVKDKPRRTPTGFAKPKALSPEMITYILEQTGIKQFDVVRNEQNVVIEINQDCKLARNELTRLLCQHFKTPGFRPETDKRNIHLDVKTQNLFKIDLDKFEGRISKEGKPVITYFQLQKYLPMHCLSE